MSTKESSVFTYQEFCAYMKRYEKENKQKSSHKVNKLAYKPVFTKKKDND